MKAEQTKSVPELLFPGFVWALDHVKLRDGFVASRAERLRWLAHLLGQAW